MATTNSDLVFQIHDLRNKIGAALSFVELLENQQPELASNNFSVSVRECLASAIEASSELSVGLGRANAMQEDASETELQLMSAIEVLSVHASEAYAALNRQFPIEIHYSYKLLDQDRSLAMDQGEIASIRENIVSNAVDSGAQNLKVTYEMKEYGLLILMQDDGCGMDEDELNKLLLKKLGDGQVHGLGTRRIMSAIVGHESSVTYFSRKGEGTQVKILCPYANAADTTVHDDNAMLLAGTQQISDQEVNERIP